MTWVVEQGESVHPILGLALGESDEVVVELPIASGSAADGRTLGELQLNLEPGFTVLALRRGQRYIYRPRGGQTLYAGDEIIASGPDEGREHLATRCGWHLNRDAETGEEELVPA